MANESGGIRLLLIIILTRTGHSSINSLSFPPSLPPSLPLAGTVCVDSVFWICGFRFWICEFKVKVGIVDYGFLLWI
jgi:hypothetical protein